MSPWLGWPATVCVLDNYPCKVRGCVDVCDSVGGIQHGRVKSEGSSDPSGLSNFDLWRVRLF